jgi:hypothetical protein
MAEDAKPRYEFDVFGGRCWEDKKQPFLTELARKVNEEGWEILPGGGPMKGLDPLLGFLSERHYYYVLLRREVRR